MPDWYGALLRPLLFMLPPEAAQKLAHLALQRKLPWRLASPVLGVRNSRLTVSLAGLLLENPVGVAAGFDKNCELLPSLARLGFGYLVGGTVTETLRPGNPRPRLRRRVKEQSLVNALGFPNKGLESAARELSKARGAVRKSAVVASVSGNTADEMVRCHRRLEPQVDAVELNISSPNSAGLRIFHDTTVLAELIDRINEGRSKPLMVKLPPYKSLDLSETSESEGRDMVLSLVRVCIERGVDAVTAANSRPVADARLSMGTGGLSGRAVFLDVLRIVNDIKDVAGERLAINACGGIFSGEDAWQALQAGASTVQLYTGLVYRGPGIAGRINRELLAIMDREGVDSLSAVNQVAKG